MGRQNKNTRDRRTFAVTFPIASTAATRAFKTLVARKRCFVERVDYINDTGLAVDPANYYNIAVKNGSAVINTLANTNTSGGAAIVANTVYNGTLGTKAARTLAAGDTVTFEPTKTGTQTLPIGTFVLWITELN